MLSSNMQLMSYTFLRFPVGNTPLIRINSLSDALGVEILVRIPCFVGVHAC